MALRHLTYALRDLDLETRLISPVERLTPQPRLRRLAQRREPMGGERTSGVCGR